MAALTIVDVVMAAIFQKVCQTGHARMRITLRQMNIFNMSYLDVTFGGKHPADNMTSKRKTITQEKREKHINKTG